MATARRRLESGELAARIHPFGIGRRQEAYLHRICCSIRFYCAQLDWRHCRRYSRSRRGISRNVSCIYAPYILGRAQEDRVCVVPVSEICFGSDHFMAVIDFGCFLFFELVGSQPGHCQRGGRRIAESSKARLAYRVAGGSAQHSAISHCQYSLMSRDELPLVTFGLFSYNQREFIGAAVRAALSQTYCRLQIIISDDASSDDTADIIRREIAEYSGQHQIVLNVNERNLGIGAHVNKMFEMADGELIIFGAGDDISSAERTQRFVDHWVGSGRSADAIYSNCHTIDSLGNAVGLLDTAIASRNMSVSELIGYHGKRLLLLGACSAYTPAVYSRFGPLRSSLGVEDIPLTVRASMLGGLSYLDEDLVAYRVNVSVWLPRKLDNETFARHLQRLEHRIRANHEISTQMLKDSMLFGEGDAITAAVKRFVFTDYGRARQQAFSVIEYFRTATFTGSWLSLLFPAALLSMPRLHRLLFSMKRQMASFWRHDG
ncbi:MAG: glycosyltransferase [Alcaligenaceae bacterium]|nr:MAG: glycosyltransferase [Alcaligenaceae bacterium]